MVVFWVFSTRRTPLQMQQEPSGLLKLIYIFDSIARRDISSGIEFRIVKKSFISWMETPFFLGHIFKYIFNVKVCYFYSIFTHYSSDFIRFSVWILDYFQKYSDSPVSYTHLRAHETRHDL